MLFFSLIASTLLLVYANWVVRQTPRPGLGLACAALTVAIGPFFMLCVLPTVAIQGLLLLLAMFLWRESGRGRSDFVRRSIGATLLAYAMGSILVYQSEREYDRLRRAYPMESMEARVPEPRAEYRAGVLPEKTSQRLATLEETVSDIPWGFRKYELQQLHENTVGLFINSPGFGVGRMLRPTARGLEMPYRKESVPAQPGPALESAWSPGEWRPPSSDLEEDLGKMLLRAIPEFVDPYGFGYIKDRRHVAGFLGHGFHRDTPTTPDRWQLQRLELVSLLLHDEPTVYVSDRLPEMTRSHNAPSRPLDRFERVGLDTLGRGEDLFVAEVGEGHLRMMGALRSAKACVACHGGGRGDLLGAFSYTLRK